MPDINHLTPLLIAIRREHWNSARLLVARGAVPDYRDVVECKNAALRKDLLNKARGDVNQAENGSIVLNDAADAGYADAVRLLLDKGARVDTIDSIHQTALLHAACSGHADIVKMLLAKGANIAYKNYSGETALRLAQQYHHADVAALLKQAGAKE